MLVPSDGVVSGAVAGRPGAETECAHHIRSRGALYGLVRPPPDHAEGGAFPRPPDFPWFDVRSVFCAAADDASPCIGDSGSPVVVAGDRSTVVGVTSAVARLLKDECKDKCAAIQDSRSCGAHRHCRWIPDECDRTPEARQAGDVRECADVSSRHPWQAVMTPEAKALCESLQGCTVVSARTQRLDRGLCEAGTNAIFSSTAFYRGWIDTTMQECPEGWFEGVPRQPPGIT